MLSLHGEESTDSDFGSAYEHCFKIKSHCKGDENKILHEHLIPADVLQNVFNFYIKNV